MEINESVWKLMSRYLFDEATVEERQQFEQILQKDSIVQQQFDIVSQVFQKDGAIKYLEEGNCEQKVLKLLLKAQNLAPTAIANEKKEKSYRKFWRWMAAAVIIGLLGAGALFLFHSYTYNVPLKMAGKTKNGKRKSLLLEDGTKVWLNAGSTLYYMKGFGINTREVVLEGEAFFDVVEKESQPFIVHTEQVLIKVSGTAFNVKAYHEDWNVTTSLYRGQVSVCRINKEGAEQPIMLYPNQKITVPILTNVQQKMHALQELPPVKIEFLDSFKTEAHRVETAWMYNRLDFREEDFLSLSHKMEHWFNVKIHFEEEAVKRFTFSGSFAKETIGQAMQALQLANPFLYTIKNNEVFISADP